jgi:sortase A
MTKRKKRRSLVLLPVLLLLAGLGMMLYPTLSEQYYWMNKAEIRTEYDEEVQRLDDSARQAALAAARQYNERLCARTQTDDLKALTAGYDDILNVNGRGLMGWVSIPSIDVHLPVYHGTTESVLAHGVGHMMTSSFPIGGTGTHAALSAHTGTAQQRLFSDLEQVREGDVFFVTVLGDTLAYEVDQISVVSPADVRLLEIDRKQDLVTLITCTPYGINSHRLLVRGHRVNLPEAEMEELIHDTPVSSAAGNVWRMRYLHWSALGILLAVIVVLLCLLGLRLWRTYRRKRP